MTKFAIISDLHANIDALNLVLKDIERKNVDKIICLGDLVTKYFYPAEVVDAIKDSASIVLKGNCDNLVANDERYKFAREKLGLNRIEYLNSLDIKYQMLINKILIHLYHSNPNDLEAMFNPLFNDNEHTSYKNNTITDYNNMFVSNKPQISIVGHTHQDFIGIEKSNRLKIINNPTVSISNNDRAIINVGSVGEHSKLILKNGKYIPNIDSYLTYAIIDDKNNENCINVQIVKVPYKNTLKKVYMNMVDLQKNGQAPYSPNDTNKVYNSLLNMGYSESDIPKQSKGRL